MHDIQTSQLTHSFDLAAASADADEEDSAINSLVFHPNDPNLLYASAASEIKVIDLRTGPGEVASFSHNKEEVNQVGVCV